MIIYLGNWPGGWCPPQSCTASSRSGPTSAWTKRTCRCLLLSTWYKDKDLIMIFCIWIVHWSVLEKVKIESPPPPHLYNLCFITFMECSKSNGVCLKVLTTNLDCEKKLTKSTFACGSPMQLSQTSFLFSQNVLTKSAWSQLDTETNTFVREVFGQQTFFASKAIFKTDADNRMC